MTTIDQEIVDHAGRVLRRAKQGEVIRDGEGLRVPLRLMDAENPALAAAMSLASSVMRAEQFDMRQHPQASRMGSRDEQSYAARDAYMARTHDQWKNPGPAVRQVDLDRHKACDAPNVTDMASLETFRDQLHMQKDERLRAAYLTK